MTTQEESAAWLAKNRPDLVNAPSTTAQQAAATNAGYINNTLPVTPTRGDPVGTYGYNRNADYSRMSQAQRAAAYSQEGNPLTLTYRDGKAVYLTDEEYQQEKGVSPTQYENIKYNIFNNPSAVDPSNIPSDLQQKYSEQQTQNVHEYYMRNPSPEFQAIQSQYAAQQNRVVGPSSVMYQGDPAKSGTNPFGSDNALAIAWEVGKTGGATDLNMNLIAEREGLAQGVDTRFIRYASDVYQERPQFETEILTTKEGQQFINPEWHGVPIRMNLTKEEMAAGGGITKDNFGKFLKYDTGTYQLNRLESPDTQFGIDSGVHKAFGDFGGPWLKDGAYGGWRPGGSSGDRLVGGKTVASQAITTDTTDINSLPKPFISSPETTRIENPEGTIFGMYVPGISEGLAFFEPKTKVTTTEKRTPMDPVTTFGEPYTEGDTTFYPSTTKSGDIVDTTTVATPIPGSSGFDIFESNIRKMMPSVPVGEKAMEIASAATPFSTGFAPIRAGKEIAFGAASALGVDTTEAKQTDADIIASTDMFKGQYESAYEHPTLAVGSYAAGALFGTVFKAAGAVGGATRARMAPALISKGQTARAVEMTGAGMWKAAQVGMAGLYAADLSGRATKGFTDLSPASVAPRARAMAVQEVYPMVVGFGAPDRAIKAVRMSDIGYKQAVLEKQTSGRADWYIKQPVTRVATKPIELIKQDYRAFLQEQTAKTPQVQIRKPGFTDYLSYKIDKPIAPESSTIRIPQRYSPTELGLQPVSTEYGAEIIRPAYGKQNIIGQTISKKLGIGRTPVAESPFLRTSESTIYQGGVWTKVIREPVGDVSPELSLKAYGKQKTPTEWFEDVTMGGKQKEVFSFTERRDVVQFKAETIQPTIKPSTQKIGEQEYTKIIKEYTGPTTGLYQDKYNIPLRSGRKPEVGGKMLDVNALFEQHYAPENPEYLYRGLSGNTSTSIQGKFAGDIYTDRGIQSFSRSFVQAKMFATSSGGTLNYSLMNAGNLPRYALLKYKPMTGEKLLDVTKLSQVPGEDEFLVAPGRFRIKSVSNRFIGVEVGPVKLNSGKMSKDRIFSRLIDKVRVFEIERIPEQRPISKITPTLVETKYGERIIPESEAMGLSRVYPTMPVNLRVKAFVQEHPSKFISDAKIMLWEPEVEIGNINRASRVRLGDMFKGSPRAKGKSTLNIWGTQPQPFISRAPTAYPETKTAETKTKGGQTLVSRTEMAQTNFPVETMQETGFRGGIVYPSGPSPIQRKRSYEITEEEEYYRLPPGMKSPGKQKQDTIQSVMQIPMVSTGFSTMTTQMPSLVSKQVQESRIKSDIFQASKQDQRVEPDLTFRQNTVRSPARDIFSGQKSETSLVSEPRFDIRQWSEPTQKTTTTQKTTEIVTEITRTPPPPPPPPPPPLGFGGGFFPGGGGGGRQYGNLGVTQWRRENLVADLPYLSRGIGARDFGFADDRQSLNPFAGSGSPRKRRSKKRKK